MGVVTFTSALADLEALPGTTVFHRPRAVCLNSLLDPARKVLALGWNYNQSTSEPVTYTKTAN